MPGSATPRYLPDRPLPPYRHQPGQTPHPNKHPQGHSYHQADDYTGPPLTRANWHRHTAYLWGVDLYNHAYWWEAHEAWEGPWRISTGLARPFLQGLIQTGAALVKWRQHQPRGQDRLYRKGKDRLVSVLSRCTGPTYMGLNLAKFLLRLDALFIQPADACDQPCTPLIDLER